MARRKKDPLDQFFDKRCRYEAKSKKEGKAIVAACLAAAKVFDSPIYRGHSALQSKAVINGNFIPLEMIKEAIKANTIREVLRKFPFPEDTYFSQWLCVDFGMTPYSFIMVELEGKLEKGKINWRVKSVTAPNHPDILTEEELKRFS